MHVLASPQCLKITKMYWVLPIALFPEYGISTLLRDFSDFMCWEEDVSSTHQWGGHSPALRTSPQFPHVEQHLAAPGNALRRKPFPLPLLHYINCMIGRKKGLPKGHLLKHDLMTF